MQNVISKMGSLLDSKENMLRLLKHWELFELLFSANLFENMPEAVAIHTDVIRSVIFVGENKATRRQLENITLFMEGDSITDIAELRKCDESTVRQSLNEFIKYLDAHINR